MPGHIPSPAAQSPQLAKLRSGHLRRYWLAGVLGFVGLATTFLAGLQVDRWARASDAERFTTESRVIAGMIQQKMGRYEAALARLADACARSRGEISATDWNGWLNTLQFHVNSSSIRCVLVAPKLQPADREAFGQRAASAVPGHPGTIRTSTPDATEWAPVWQRWVAEDVVAPELGEDLLVEGLRHPTLEPALGATYGWVSLKTSLPGIDGRSRPGFWFAIPLQPLEFTNAITHQLPGEPDLIASMRRWRQRADRSTGILAAFVDGDLFLADFNSDNGPRPEWIQLFTTKSPDPESLLNPAHSPPPNPRFSSDLVMPWYTRRWTARFHSTPAFETGSQRYRAWAAWGIGSVLSLGAAAMLAWQTQGRLREAALAGQLREALARQERLSRDLHDGTLQSIYGVGLGLQRARRLLQNHSADADPQIADSTRALQGVIGELRAFIRDSDPTTREEVPLGEALKGVIGHLDLASEMKLELEVAPGADHGLTPAQSLQLLNIAREAVSNSVRHSKADRVRVRLDQSDGWVRLEVSDDGSGFNPETAEREGRGLRNLVARIRELHGIHRWESAVGQGSRLIVEVPLR